MSSAEQEVRKLPCWETAIDGNPTAAHFLRVGEWMMPWGFFAACVALVLAACARPESLRAFGICVYSLIAIIRTAEFISEFHLTGQALGFAPDGMKPRVRHCRRVVVWCAILNLLLLVAFFRIIVADGPGTGVSSHPLT